MADEFCKVFNAMLRCRGLDKPKRHRPFMNFIVNLIGGIAAYCLFPKKPMTNLERVYDNQLTFF